MVTRQPRWTLSQVQVFEAEVWPPQWSEKKDFSHVPFRIKDTNRFNWTFQAAPHMGFMSVVIQLVTCGVFVFVYSLLHVMLRTRVTVLTAQGTCFNLSWGGGSGWRSGSYHRFGAGGSVSAVTSSPAKLLQFFFPL